MFGSAQLISLSVLSAAPGDASEIEAALKEQPRLELVLRLALDRNPNLEEARARVLAAKDRAEAAGGLPDLEFKYEQWGVPLRRPYGLDEADTLMFGLRQSFPAPGTLGARSRAGELESKMLSENEAERRQELAAEVRRAYAEYYRVEREFRLHVAHVEIASNILELARANYQAGRGTQEDVLRAVVELSRLHRDVAHIDQERTSAKAMLNTLMAREPDAPLGPPEQLRTLTATLDPKSLVTRALAERPELRAASAAVARSEASVEGAEDAANWPSFMVGVDYWLQPANEEVTHAYGAMLAVSLPWINPRHRDEVRAERQALVAEKRARESAENAIRFQVHDTVARLAAAREAFLIIDRDLLKQAEQSFEAARSGYAAGTSDALRMLDAMRMFLEVRLEHERARAHWATASAEVARAVGIGLDDLEKAP